MQVIAYLSPPEVAERYHVDVHKIIGWIRTGQLAAINVGTTTGKRPRYRISPSDLAAFEQRRSAGPQPKISRVRRHKDPNVIQFF